MPRRGKQRKSSRLTLRLEPEIHSRLTKVAFDLGLGVNGVANLILVRGLGQMELEAKVYLMLGGVETDSQFEEMEEWVRENTGKTRRDYITFLIDREMGRTEHPPASRLPDVSGPPA